MLDRMWFLASMPFLQRTHCVSHPSKPTGIPPALTTAPPAWRVSLLAEIPQVFIGNTWILIIYFFIRVHAWLILYDSAFLAVQPCAMKKPNWSQKTSLMNSASNSSMFSFFTAHSSHSTSTSWVLSIYDRQMNEWRKTKRKYGSVYTYLKRCMSTNIQQLQSVACLFSF